MRRHHWAVAGLLLLVVASTVGFGCLFGWAIGLVLDEINLLE